MARTSRVVDAYGVLVLREFSPPPLAEDIRRDFSRRCARVSVYFPSVRQDGHIDDTHQFAGYVFVCPSDTVYELRRSRFVESILQEGRTPVLVLCPEVWGVLEPVQEEPMVRGMLVRITHGPWKGLTATVARVKSPEKVMVTLPLRSTIRTVVIERRWVEPVV